MSNAMPFFLTKIKETNIRFKFASDYEVLL